MKLIKTPAVVMTTAIALLVLLAGCGQSNSGTGPGNTDVRTGGARFSTADEETAKLGSDAAPGVFPRTVTHAAGTTEIPAKPQRIVVLDTGELDGVLSLGLMPVGMTTTAGASPVPDYLADRVKDVKSVGPLNEIDLEEVAKLKPDLILGSQLRADKLYPQLSRIAPTVFSIRPGFPWKENFRLIGDSVGMENEAVATLNTYADAADKLKTTLTNKPTISLVRFQPKGTRIYGNKSFVGVILHDAGLPRPQNQQIDELAEQISEENISQADGDVIFYTSYGKPSATGEESTLKSQGWKALSGVKNGKAYRVDDDVWYMGLGPTAGQLVVEDLTEQLMGPA